MTRNTYVKLPDWHFPAQCADRSALAGWDVGMEPGGLLLVGDRGWAREQYEHWLKGILIDQLLALPQTRPIPSARYPR